MALQKLLSAATLALVGLNSCGSNVVEVDPYSVVRNGNQIVATLDWGPSDDPVSKISLHDVKPFGSLDYINGPRQFMSGIMIDTFREGDERFEYAKLKYENDIFPKLPASFKRE